MCRRLIGAVSLFFVMTACTNESESTQSVPAVSNFNQPSTGEYFLDSADQYYANLKKTLELAQDPTANQNIERLIETPIAQWLNADTESTRMAINENLDQSKAEGTIPIFVAYNIPNRDLGGEAGGGLASASEYSQWVSKISDTIKDAPAVLILEPDAVADTLQMKNKQERDERMALLHDALVTFHRSNANMAVYLDIGNSDWVDVEAAVDLIEQVDQSDGLVGGIALNVANQRSEGETRAYAHQISQKLGRRLHVMIDNSMNGAPNTNKLLKWCNAKGEHIGTADTTYSEDNHFVEEAYIKAPGESDGQCGESTKPAGEFDPQLLIKQVS
jgi:endoglucanase